MFRLPLSLTARLALCAALAAALIAGAGLLHHKIYAEGYAACLADAASIAREKTDAANKADDAARRCFNDPACRLSDDGFERR